MASGKKKNAKTTKKDRRRARDTPAPWSPLTGLKPQTQTIICLVLLLALSFAFFWPLHFGGKQVVANDTLAFKAAAETMFEYEDRTGDPALWATNLFAGMPGFLIRYPARVFQVDTVINGLRKVIWPSSHLLVLLSGMFVLAFRITRDRWSSLVASVMFALTTYMPVILVAGHNTKFVTLCLAPWLLVAFHYALEKPRVLSAFWFAAAFAASLRGGHVQITYYILFVLLIWWLVAGVSAFRSREVRPFLISTALLFAGGILGLLMSAQPYLATYEYKAYSIRGASAPGEPAGLLWDAAMNWSQGIGELLTLIVAGAFGGAGAEYWGPKINTAGPHYFSAAIVALAISAVWAVRRTLVTGLAIAAFVLTLFSLGSHLEVVNRFMFNYFPLFDAFRAPETWLSVVAPIVALLAAIGLASAVESSEASNSGHRDRDLWRKLTITFGVIAAVLAVIVVASGAFFSFSKSGEFERIASAIAQQQQVSPDDPRVGQATGNFMASLQETRKEMLVRDAIRSLVVLGLVYGVLHLRRRRRLGRGIAALAVALIICIDLFTVGRRYLGDDLLQDKVVTEQEVPTYDFDAYIVERLTEVGGLGHFRVLSFETSPLTNARNAYLYESVGGYHGAKLRNFQNFIERLVFPAGLGSPQRNGLDLLGVRFLVARSELPGYELAYTSPQTGLGVYERTDFVPRTRFVPGYVVQPDNEEAWLTIGTAPDIAGLAVLAKEPETQLTPAPIDSASVVEVELDLYDARTVRWRVNTDRDRLLVTSEVYYPAGWTATIDGEEVPIVEVNRLFRGVVVPRGEHVLEMEFNPASDRIGYLVALLSTLIVYGGILFGVIFWFRRRSRGPASDSSE